MNNKLRIAFTGAACCLVLLALKGCGGASPTAPTATNQAATSPTAQTATTNANARTNNAPALPPSPKAATSGGGEYVDTSKHDAEIERLEREAKRKAADQPTRLALARAYTDRGDALTGVRQYRAALGDYRRALRLDPNNAQAKQMAGTIIGILKSMGRDVPPEGQEPAPLKQ